MGIAETLSLSLVGRAGLRTALREETVGVYFVSLLLGWQQDHPPDRISVRALAPPEVLGAEVLIGLDVLRHGKLTVDGPKGEYDLLLLRTDRAAPEGCAE